VPGALTSELEELVEDSIMGAWTFVYGNLNRLKSYINTNALNVRGNLWYDYANRVWQRWNDQVIGGAWDGSLKRYVYDGGQLVQEHDWDVAEDQASWVYTYNDIDMDYLRHQGGIRQREGTATAYNDFYLQQSGAAIEIKTQRDQASATIARAERTQSLNKIAGTTFTDISNLATSNSAIAMYGGGTSGSTAGFDGLVQDSDGNSYLAGIAMSLNVKSIVPTIPSNYILHASFLLFNESNMSNKYNNSPIHIDKDPLKDFQCEKCYCPKTKKN